MVSCIRTSLLLRNPLSRLRTRGGAQRRRCGSPSIRRRSLRPERGWILCLLENPPSLLLAAPLLAWKRSLRRRLFRRHGRGEIARSALTRAPRPRRAHARPHRAPPKPPSSTAVSTHPCITPVMRAAFAACPAEAVCTAFSWGSSRSGSAGVGFRKTCRKPASSPTRGAPRKMHAAVFGLLYIDFE